MVTNFFWYGAKITNKDENKTGNWPERTYLWRNSLEFNLICLRNISLMKKKSVRNYVHNIRI